MTELRKYARFQLMVVGLTALAVTAVFLATGNAMASLSGFAVMALLGVRAMTFRGRRQGPVQDERDEAILRRAYAVGYTALWLFLVAWGVVVSLAFSDEGGVPLVYVAPVVMLGWWLMTLVRSITILMLDSRGL